jgi:hypothetical protein
MRCEPCLNPIRKPLAMPCSRYLINSLSGIERSPPPRRQSGVGRIREDTVLLSLLGRGLRKSNPAAEFGDLIGEGSAQRETLAMEYVALFPMHVAGLIIVIFDVRYELLSSEPPESFFPT